MREGGKGIEEGVRKMERKKGKKNREKRRRRNDTRRKEDERIKDFPILSIFYKYL